MKSPEMDGTAWVGEVEWGVPRGEEGGGRDGTRVERNLKKMQEY